MLEGILATLAELRLRSAWHAASISFSQRSGRSEIALTTEFGAGNRGRWWTHARDRPRNRGNRDPRSKTYVYILRHIGFGGFG
jgi:hypothetical protein